MEYIGTGEFLCAGLRNLLYNDQTNRVSVDVDELLRFSNISDIK